MENDRYKGLPPLTSSEFWRKVAEHMATQFTPNTPEVKNFFVAANALDEGDIEKAERILGTKLQP